MDQVSAQESKMQRRSCGWTSGDGQTPTVRPPFWAERFHKEMREENQKEQEK